MPVLETYWSGVLQRLQAEVEVFSDLVRHQGEKGRANELAFANLLLALLPRRFGIGTGLVIDSADHQSRQMDIVVFEQADQPTLLAQTTQLLHPVETVPLCVEVKTTLASGDLGDFVKKRQSLNKLVPLADHPRPMFVLLAYNTSLKPDKIATWLGEAGESGPDIVCVIGDALVGAAGEVFGDGTAGRVGMVLLQKRGPGGERLSEYVEAPQPKEMEAIYEGRLHPVVDHAGARVLADPARALLLLVDGMLALLAKRGAMTPSVLSGYISTEARAVAWI